MNRNIRESNDTKHIEGRYNPTELEDCKSILPIDRNPNVIRFVQQVLISNSGETDRGITTNDAKYLIVQPYRFPGRDDDAIVNQVIKPLSKKLTTLLTNRGVKEGEGKGIQRVLTPLVQTGFISPTTLQTTNLGKAINEALTQSLLPSAYQPLKSPHPHMAICAVFEQVWEHKGYTRGELINTISLAPGEQLTLEFHSWDKSTIKSEEELAQEMEIRASEILTERDSLTVVREMSRQMGASYAPNVSVSLPGVGTISGSGIDLSGSISENFTETTEDTSERTTESSFVLKNTRKIRIETSREVGREEKQTRNIANTNRCHSLNCHYFEVMSNYQVTTRLYDVLPCILVPRTKPAITPAWVLCHEDILKQVLLSKNFLPGFEAARILETCRLYNNRFACSRLIKLPDITSGEISEDILVSLLDDILQPYLDLEADVRGFFEEIWDVYIPDRPDFLVDFWGTLDWVLSVTILSDPQRLRSILALALIHGNPTAINALKKLQQQRGKVSARNLLHSFFSAAVPSHFQFDVVERSTVSRGLESLGIPKALANALLDWGVLDLVPNDLGLQQAVQATDQRLFQIGAMGQADRLGSVARPLTNIAPNAGRDLAAAPDTSDKAFSHMELAKAQVDFNQLKCHIEDNRSHYDQALWHRMHPDRRLEHLQEYFPSIATIVRNEILGYIGDKAAYPVANFDAIDQWAEQVLEISLTELISDIKKKYEDSYKAEPKLITLPTQGTVLEAVVGQCDACEDFIQQSRLIDLRMQEARAKQEESEADRFKKKVENGDYTDPRGPGAGKFIVKLEKDENEEMS